ncbi:GntR family transcriptional regulator [Maritimibacter sp. DP1N21-5]|uniref:GntR family transcriptional regulator n=1 Tax=Maritimibacter sp. DP1N21-5 TaxID=2836867 RepID=UPI001C44AFF5|nr:GntR family transcriptional regulator [Maritimibacter sp. DP1N21-5]MBV7408539.1 GntR family transcriptional regulator [Maritimibacter sp. DP1N21-5]
MARPIPAHRRLAEEIRRRIVASTYEEELPPEVQLMKEFDVSRHTMRIALQHLVDDGLIVRMPGSGTRIVRKGRAGYWAIGSLDDLTGEFKVEQSLTISAQQEPAKAFPEVVEILGLRPTSKVFHILRVLTTDGIPYGVSNLFAPMSLVKNIPDAELGQTYFVDLVQKYSGHTASRTRQAISAGAVDPEAARQLGIEAGAPVLVIKRTYFASDNLPLVHVHLTCRSDRYEQVVTYLRERRDDDPTA